KALPPRRCRLGTNTVSCYQTDARMLRETAKGVAPAYKSLRYYGSLFRGEFSKEDTMKAHLQDLARSVGCQGLRQIQLLALDEFCGEHVVDPVDHEHLREAIEDELPGDERPSHWDVRLQMFEGLGFAKHSLMSVTPLQPANEATSLFRDVFTLSLLEMTAAVGSIELWYVPLASRLFECYRKLGYSDYQLATYSLHATADIGHSSAALAFVDKYSAPDQHAHLLAAVRQGFKSVILYDEARFAAAMDKARDFEDYLPHHNL
ncbi:MAG: iron-containing redox enzyme family protein, partial [Terracidiphilus sp.]